MALTRHIGSRLLAAVLVVSAGCGRGAVQETESAAVPAAEPAADTTPAQSPAPAITIAPVSNIHPERFPHNAHRTVACGTCHTRVPGHDAHARLQCSECHESAPGNRARPTPAQCRACHHGADQARTCVDCHDSARPAKQLPVPAKISVRDSVTTLTLPFEHERHSGQQCTTCHDVRAGVTAPRPCSSCHDFHHQADRRCSTCHAPMPLAKHDRLAHLGCGGSGCHQDAAVTALPMTRPVCLVCHRQQEDHEPGRECALCHLFSGGGAGLDRIDESMKANR